MPALSAFTRMAASLVVVNTSLFRYGSFSPLASFLQYVSFFVKVMVDLSADIPPSSILNGPVPIICREHR